MRAVIARPEAGAAGIAIARLCDAIERLEDALQVRLRHARSTIVDDDRDLRPGAIRTHAHRRTTAW